MKPKHKRLINILFLLCLVSLGVFVLIQNFRDNLIYFYTATDIVKLKKSSPKKFEELFNDKKIRVGGMIKKNSLKKIDTRRYIFKVTDYKNDVKINYKGILPPMFREGQGVVAEGFLQKFYGKKYLKKKSYIFKFKAEKLITKHDEKYMPPELKKLK